MSNPSEDQARAHMHKLLAAMKGAGGSDLFIAADFPPSIKAHGNMQPLTAQKLSGSVTRTLAHALMNERQREEFARDFECNFAISVPGVSRFRVNVFIQQQQVGMVIRTIASEIPTCEKLGLPDTLKEIVMHKRGLVLVVGATGSGKSTSLAAMIDHRNCDLIGPYHHDRGSGRVRAPVEEFAGDAPGGRRRHAFVAWRAEEHAAPGARRHSHRRNSRCRDDGARDHLRRNRASVPRHAAREQRQPDARPHRQLLPGGAPQPAADGPVGKPAQRSFRNGSFAHPTAKAARRRSKS